jgi:hypothetical protein
MSDDENVSMEVAPTEKKRQLSQEQLDKLAIARQKANLVRKNKSEEKLKMCEKENELKRLQAQAKADDIDDQINQLSSKPIAKSKKRAPRKKAPVREETESESEESESEQSSKESEEESEEEDEDEFMPPKRAQRRSKGKVKVRRSQREKPQRKQPQRRQPRSSSTEDEAYTHRMNTALNSLFPN